jgi:hypothetical protein
MTPTRNDQWVQLKKDPSPVLPGGRGMEDLNLARVVIV